MRRNRWSVWGALVFLLVACFAAGPTHAALWESDATAELTGSRTSPIADGIDATDGWNNGGFDIAWDITQDNGIWTYRYTVDVERKDLSHFILEVTEDGNPFAILDGTDIDIEGPRIWSQDTSNPSMPNDLYGIKFDFGGSTATYTIVTNRAPVYGVFYAKDGRDGGDPVVAWSNALNYADYRTNDDLTTTDFIVRPNSVPIQGGIWLLGSGLLSLAAIHRNAKRK